MIDINLNLPIDITPTDGSTNLIDSNAVFDGLALKVDKVTGKQLSTEDYTTTEKSKLAGIASGAEVNVNADFNATSGDAQILNKPTIDSLPTDGSANAVSSNGVFDGLATKENNLPSIVGNSLKVLRVNAGETAKEWATISTGLTIGTTPITSGTVGRVLFEGAGNVVQESAGLTFSSTYSETIITNPAQFSGNQINYPLLKLTQPLLGFGNSSVVFRAVESSVNNSFSIALYKRSGYSETHFLVGGNGSGTNTETPFMAVIGDNFNSNGSLYINKSRVNIGYGITGGGAGNLDIKSGGSLSTDIAFRVRNSADTGNVFNVNGDYVLQSRRSNNTEDTLRIDGTNNFVELFKTDATQHRGIRFSKNANNLNTLEYFTQNASVNGHFLFKSTAPAGGYGTSAAAFVFQSGNESTAGFTIAPRNIALSSLSPTAIQAATLGKNVFHIQNNTVPTTDLADHFAMYSADIVAGNAAPHFRTENGSVIKLYKQDLPTNPTNAELATFLSNLGFANLI